MENELFYRLALTRVRGIGAFRAKILFNHFGEAAAVFRASPTALAKIRGIGQARGWEISRFKQFRAVEKEMAFLEKYRIKALFFTDKDYPQRMAGNKDAPVLLFYKGNTDLNTTRIIAIIGTRTPSEYGKQIIEHLVKGLAVPQLLIVSGLAYGVDAASHRAALNHSIPTVGVLGHGLDRIYPEQNAAMARQMVSHGGLITEFCIGTEPEEHNFPVRNRIIAGMSDAIIVVETGRRGGSILTIENGIEYRKKIFAVPGRTTDQKSAGCNALIQKGKACLLTGPLELLQEMKWAIPDGNYQEECQSKAEKKPHPILPPDEPEVLSSDEKKILDIIRLKGCISLDALLTNENLTRSGIPMALLNLEFSGLIRSLPGMMYCSKEKNG